MVSPFLDRIALLVGLFILTETQTAACISVHGLGHWFTDRLIWSAQLWVRWTYGIDTPPATRILQDLSPEEGSDR
jgi:hypothetical protein